MKYTDIQLKQAIDTLVSGGVVVMPTDTVYGIVCSANRPDAVEKIFDIKKRINKLGTILFANKQQLLEFGFDENLVGAAFSYWPGPVSIILPSPKNKKYLAKEWDSLAVRIPEPEWLKRLLLKTGPLATTSANYPDEPTATNIEQAKSIFESKVDFYLDGGEIINSKPSKIVCILPNGKIKVLRP
jgi:L-threonylcarbamoyladenylate synthase